MNNKEIIETITHAISANSIFLNHAYCILVQKLNLNPQLLIDELKNHPVPPNADEDFLTFYSTSKNLLLENLEAIRK